MTLLAVKKIDPNTVGSFWGMPSANKEVVTLRGPTASHRQWSSQENWQNYVTLFSTWIYTVFLLNCKNHLIFFHHLRNGHLWHPLILRAKSDNFTEAAVNWSLGLWAELGKRNLVVQQLHSATVDAGASYRFNAIAWKNKSKTILLGVMSGQCCFAGRSCVLYPIEML